MQAGAIDWQRMTPPEYLDADARALQQLKERGACAPYEKEHIHCDGHRIAVTIGGALLDGEEQGGVAFVLDITERWQAAQMQQRASTVFQAASEAIIVTDNTPAIRAVNPAFTLITGFTEEDVVGKNPNIFASGHHDADFYRAMWAELNETDHWRGEVWNRRKNGEVFPEWLSIGAVRDQHGKVAQYVGIFSDITDRKKEERVIWHQAHYDILTDLPNRALFRDRLHQQLAMARRKRSGLGVMFIDLDRFKQVNDTLGHKAGDDLLQRIARNLNESARESDTVARLSGDEFTMILPEVYDQNDVKRVADAVMRRCSEPMELNDEEVRVTLSIGIALYLQDAKDAGRNSYCFYADAEPDSE